MKLRDVELGNVFNASGARGFMGEGYWFHHLWRLFGLDWTGSTLVTKTTTLMPRLGNMMLDVDHRPFDLIPDCIVVKPVAGVVLNAVGLSGPGALTLIDNWKTGLPGATPTVLSIMSVADTPSIRLHEAIEMIGMLKPLVLARGTDHTMLQVNFSCPNVGLDTSHLVDEAQVVLDETRVLEIGTMVKLNALVPIEAAKEIAEHPGCDALVISNTIPWGQLPDRIAWENLFGSNKSPLAKYGGGGLSGKPLLPIVADWIHRARDAGITKPIVGGGGVLSKGDADELIDAGASAIELGSVAILRPWRVHGIIQHINQRLGN